MIKIGIFKYLPAIRNIWQKEQTHKEQSTPSDNPPANHHFIYLKSDGLLYEKNSSGTETQIGASAGGGVSLLGDGSDGTVTISSDTDLGSDNYKQYEDLTIDSGFTLTLDSDAVIKVTGTLTLNGDISVSGKGGAGGTKGGDGGDGGAGGGYIRIFCNAMSGTGKILANGNAGGDAGGSSSSGQATDGTDGKHDAGNLTNPTKGIAGNSDTANNISGGGGGGAGYGDGGASIISNDGGAGGTGQVFNIVYLAGLTHGSGGGGGSATSGGGIRNAGGGGGGGGVIVLVCVGNISACTLEAKGGDGGDGAGGDQWGGSGGGGGGGYVVVYSNGSDSSTKTVTGGTRGNHGGGSPQGEDGNAGASANLRSIV